MATNKEFYVKHGLKVSGNSLLNGSTYTDSASAKLHVKTASNGVGANLNNVNGLIVENSGSSDSNYALKLATGAGNIFNVTNSGEVGIGTTSTAAKLHLFTNQAEDLIFRMDSNSTGDAFIELDRQTSAGTAAIVFQDASTDVWGIGTLGADRFDIFENSSTARLSIIPGGNVGIGTDDPKSLLHIDTGSGIGTVDNAYSLAIRGDGIDGIQILSDSAYSGRIVFGDQNSTNAGRIYYDHSTDAFRFFTNGTEKVSITSGGNVGIGTDDPQRPFTLYKASNPVLQLVNSTTGTGDGHGFLLIQGALNTTIENAEAGYMAFRTSADEKMRIDAAGNVGIGTTSPDTIFHVQGTSFSTFERNTSCTNVSRTAADFDHTTTGDMAAGFGSQIRFTGGDAGCSETTFAMLRGLRGSSDSEGEFSITAGTNGGEEFMRIDSSGNVGIGTSTPTNYFSGADNLVICGGSTDSGITIATDATSSGALYFADGTTGSQAYKGGIAYIHDTSNEHLALVSGGVSQMRVCTDGQLQFNTYGSGTHTGTQAYNLGVDSSGNIIEVDLGDGVIDGGGTANRLAYWSDATTLTADSDLYYDNTNNYIGIGTDVPGEAIDIVDGNVQADEFIGNLRGAVLFKAKAGEALTKGDAVYISGISGNTTVVGKADADDAAKMPAFGIADETVSLNSSVDVIKFGTVSNLNTSAFPEGTELYIGTTAGALVSSAPTGESAAVQKIAKVTRQDASVGSVTVMGAGRSNATPNLNEGRLFVGNSSNRAVADGTIHVDIDNSRVGIGNTNPQGTLDLGNATGGKSIVWGGPTGINHYSSIWSEYGTGSLVLAGGLKSSTSSADFIYPYTGTYGYAAIELDSFHDDGIKFYTAADAARTADTVATKQERMRIDTSGKVGIGTTDPSSVSQNPRLAVVHNGAGIATFDATGTDGGYITITDSNTPLVYLGSSAQLISSGGTTTDAALRSQGELVFATGGSSERMRIDSSGNVGVNTTNPLQPFVVAEGTDQHGVEIQPGSLSYIQAYDRATSDYGDLSIDAQTLRFATDNGAERVRIDADGNVGIGIISPTGGKLQVAGKVRIDAGQGNDALNLNAYDLLKWDGANLIHFGGYQSSQWQELHFYANGAKALSIDASQNVGIGTTAPDDKLDVVGNLRISDSKTATTNKTNRIRGEHYDITEEPVTFMYMNSFSTTNTLYIGGGSSIENAATQLNFYTAANNTTTTGTVRMYIDASGNVNIGNNGNGGGAVIRPGGQTSVYALEVDRSGTGGSVDIWDNNDDSVIIGATNSEQTLTVKAGGNVGIGNTNPNKKLSVTGEVSGTSAATFDGRIQSNNQLRVSNDYSVNYFYKADNTTMLGYLLMRDDNSSFLSFPTGQDFRLKHGNTSRIAVASAGNVGIGTTSPNEKLTVSGNISASGTVYGNASEFGAMTEAGLKTEGVSELPEGTVLVWQDGKNIPCTTEADFRVMGVSLPGSDAPIVIGAEPVLVTGPVLEGQFIITSEKEGHGKAISYAEMYTVPGMYHGKVIAQALESGDGESYTIKAMIRKM